MSASSTNLHSRRLPSEAEHGQARTEVDPAQHLMFRERQRFFEEVFQHDVDVYLSSAHLCIRDYRRTPIGSISSMEVNVDLLDQMELADLADPDSLDIFYSSVGEDGTVTSPLAGNNSDGAISRGLFRHVLDSLEGKPRMSSTSSDSSCDSQNTDMDRGDTALLGSGSDEEAGASRVKRTATSAETEEPADLSLSSSS